MSIFDFLKTKAKLSVDYEKAQNEFANKKFTEAFNLLKSAFLEDTEQREYYILAEKICNAVEDPELAQAFKNAEHYFKQSQWSSNLATELSRRNIVDFAIIFLQRAVRLNPGKADLAVDLAAAYCATFQPEKGVQVLEKHLNAKDFWAPYQYYWSKLLTGKVDDCKEFLDTIFNQIKEINDETKTKTVSYVILKMQEMYDGLLKIPDRKKHIRDWQLIQYGSAILSYFGYIDQEDEKVAGGRFVAYWLSNEELVRIINSLKKFLSELNVVPTRVAYLPDRDSQIVGLLVSKLLNLKAIEYKNEPENCDLVVVADSSSLRGFNDSLRFVKDNQVLFSLNHNWTKEAGITPDVIGVLSQMCSMPWDSSLRFNPDTKLPETIPPDDREPSQIVEDLLKIETTPHDYFDNLIQFYIENKELWKPNYTKNPQRINFLTDSPIAGSRFY
jgi:hypothetical protein